ncbi:MAG: FAD-binding domain-containing protein, partial [Planctomycetota bacterium]
MQLVWLKRDLRTRDHPALDAALQHGPTAAVYIYEPSLWQQPEMSAAHLAFINECLADLRERLDALRVPLIFRVGEVTGALGRLHDRLRFSHLWSHEETGLAVTYERDRAVKRWCRDAGVPWTELPQTGVIRGLTDRDGWARRWQARMKDAPLPEPEPQAQMPDLGDLQLGDLAQPTDLGLKPSSMRGIEGFPVQQGGQSRALSLLDSFLNHRGVNYRADMATPNAGWDACSRLSTHLAWGSISIRTLHHATRERQAELRELKLKAERDSTPVPFDKRWQGSLTSFQGRLRWHCHFMQKLETEPEIEHRNMNRAYDGVRTEDPSDWTADERTRFDAWCAGQTGYPMIDAAMRCLHSSGWMNFRMRSMLVSFASYHLWLHWKPTATFLAQHFLDFEPGIHFSQFQMQSGVTGINTV